LYGEYTKDEAITDNCHIRIAYTPNRIDSAKELSETAGNFTASHTQRQYSGNRLQVLLQHVNTNEQVIQRPLLTPEEFMRLPATDEVVFVSGHAPIYCQKIIYYTDPVLNKRRAIPPPASSFPADGPALAQASPPAGAVASATDGTAGMPAAGSERQQEEADPQAVIAEYIGVKSSPKESPTVGSPTVESTSPESKNPVKTSETRSVEEQEEEQEETGDDPLA
jgi:type IV secretion system protein VirD4